MFFSALFGGSKRRPIAKRTLAFESLERRELMAANLMATFDGANLRIEGTEAADQIVVRQVNNQLSIDHVTIREGATAVRAIASSRVGRIEIDALGGDDVIRLNSENTRGQQPITISATIRGGAGNDSIIGGLGSDTIFGQLGNDTIMTGGASDTSFNLADGGGGNDQLYGAAGVDHIYGDLGNDRLWGAGGDDWLAGGDGNDSLYGGDGNDWLDGGRHYDYLYGEWGNDRLTDDFGQNLFQGGSGNNATENGHFAWFDQNTADQDLRSLARSLWTDRSLSRTDVLALLGQTRSDGVVSGTELTDLRTITSNALTLGLRDDVWVLLGKVVNPHGANAKFQGRPLGNLVAGSTAAHLATLTGKWFMGADRPELSSARYAYASGSLFVGGATWGDIDQGYLSNCYFLAGLAGVAQRSPGTISTMFIDNGDGTFAVRFYHQGVVDFVTVDRWLPVDADGLFVYSNQGRHHASSRNELWVPLAEKAYAQLNEAGWLGRTAGNAYTAIEYGYADLVLMQLTGQRTARTDLNRAGDLSDLIAAVNAGKPVVVDSGLNPRLPHLVANHAYLVVNYTASTRSFTLYNPHGGLGAVVTLTESQLLANFLRFHRTL